MKLEKGSLFAIAETACFVIGAIFFVMVIAIPANPIWALIAGIFFGLAGAIIWSCSLIVHAASKVGHKIHDQIERTVVNQVDAEKVAKSILDDEDNTYELHRADSYDDLTDITMEQHAEENQDTEPAVEIAPEPQQPTEQEIEAEQRAEKRKQAAENFKKLMLGSKAETVELNPQSTPQPEQPTKQNKKIEAEKSKKPAKAKK